MLTTAADEFKKSYAHMQTHILDKTQSFSNVKPAGRRTGCPCRPTSHHHQTQVKNALHRGFSDRPTDTKHENNTRGRRRVLRSSIMWPRVTLSESKTLLITPADPPAYRPPGHCSVLSASVRPDHRNSPTVCLLFETTSHRLNLVG